MFPESETKKTFPADDVSSFVGNVTEVDVCVIVALCLERQCNNIICYLDQTHKRSQTLLSGDYLCKSELTSSALTVIDNNVLILIFYQCHCMLSLCSKECNTDDIRFGIE